MIETTKQRDEKALNLLEAIGHAAVQVECAQNELDEIEKSGNDIAMRLRVVANCLDSERPEKIRGMLEGNMFFVDNCEAAYSSVSVIYQDNPSVKDIFEIPGGIRSLMKRMRETENLLLSYKDSLKSLLRSFMYNNFDGVE